MADNPPRSGWGISGAIGGATAVITALAAIVGMLNQLGYVGGGSKATTVNASKKTPSNDSVDTSPAVSDQPRRGIEAPAGASTLAMIQPGKPFNLSGAWRDAGMGACHLITQTGTDLKIVNYYPTTGEVWTHGDGTVDGSHVELRLRSMRGEFQISPDGKVLQGSMTRTSGTHPSMWQYIGTSCTKPG